MRNSGDRKSGEHDRDVQRSPPAAVRQAGVTIPVVRAPRAVDPANREALRHAATQDGALWLQELIPATDIALLAERVDDWLRTLSWIDDNGHPLVPTPAYDAPDFVRLQQWAFPSAEFDALRRHPRLIEVLEIVLGGLVKPCLGDLLRVTSPGDPSSETLPHQDAFYLKNVPLFWTAWMPLIPTPLALGPLAIWPGSHRLGVLPHGDGLLGVEVPEEVCWVAADMAPGDVWLFERRCVHRSLPNSTARTMRRSVDFRHAPAAATQG